jgi:hypothetical protein
VLAATARTGVRGRLGRARSAAIAGNRTAVVLTTRRATARASRHAAALRTRDGLALLDASLTRRLASTRTRLARLLRGADADVEAFETALDEHLAAAGRSLAGARRGEELTREVRGGRACARPGGGHGGAQGCRC